MKLVIAYIPGNPFAEVKLRESNLAFSSSAVNGFGSDENQTPSQTIRIERFCEDDEVQAFVDQLVEEFKFTAPEKGFEIDRPNGENQGKILVLSVDSLTSIRS